MDKKTVDEAAMSAFGRTRTEAEEKGICVSCGKKPEQFRDKASEREWQITLMCQSCQDAFYSELAEMEGL